VGSELFIRDRSSPLWRPTPLPPRNLRPLRWLPVLLAALAILPNYSEDVWAQQIPNLQFLADGTYRQYIAPGSVVWVLEVHPSRQLIWQADTGFYFRLSGGFFGGTPEGLPQGTLQQRLAMGQVGPAVTAADISNYIAVHHVGTIIAAQVPWDVILKVRAAVGSRGMKQGHAVVFRLTVPFSGPGGQVRRLAPAEGSLVGPQRRLAQHGQRAQRHHRQHQAHR
jgi:hypothetical protein